MTKNCRYILAPRLGSPEVGELATAGCLRGHLPGKSGKNHPKIPGKSGTAFSLATLERD